MDNAFFKNFYDENGYVIAKSLIQEELIDKVLTDLEKCKQGSRIYFTQSTHSWVRFSNLTEEGFLAESIQTPTKQISAGPLRKSVENLIVSKSLSEKLSLLSGGFDKFVVWQNMLFDKSTGTVDHSDTWYLDTMPEGLMIAVWIALEDIHEDAGRFFVIPKSNKLKLEQNSSEKISDHYEYAKFIDDYVNSKKLFRYAPPLKKGDVLFWHPNTIHGSFSQVSSSKSRKSITCHYHPLGIGRKNQNSVSDIKKILKKLKPTENNSIFLDNVDPSEFSFFWMNLFKFYVKKYIFRRKKRESSIMDRKIVLK